MAQSLCCCPSIKMDLRCCQSQAPRSVFPEHIKPFSDINQVLVLGFLVLAASHAGRVAFNCKTVSHQSLTNTLHVCSFSELSSLHISAARCISVSGAAAVSLKITFAECGGRVRECVLQLLASYGTRRMHAGRLGRPLSLLEDVSLI